MPNMSDAVITLDNVTKMYGDMVGVKEISLQVPQGSVFGFLGPNGAGKTTTISMIVDLIRPTSGSIKLFGLDSVAHSRAIRARIGFLAGDIALDEGLSGWQQLEYFGALHGEFNKKYVRELSARLDCKLNRKFKHLSRGNKQKVGLIAALMHQPELLILDEPTSGLDPLIQAEFNKIILEYKQAGKTVFISSHILSEVQEICDQVAFIRDGQVGASKPLSEIIEGLPKRVRILGASKELQQKLHKLSGAEAIKTSDGLVTCTYSGKPQTLLKLLAGEQVTDVTIQDYDLETIFMKYYEG
jgi:ABC-2 type transport system ATP-binding protein